MKTFRYTIVMVIFIGVNVTWGALDAGSLHHNGHILMNHALSGILKFWLLFFAMLALRKQTWKETWPDVLIFWAVMWITFDLAFAVAHPLLDWYYVGVTAWTDVPFRWVAGWFGGNETVTAFVIQFAAKSGILIYGASLKV